MAPWIAGTSTIFTSLTFHCAPKAADPAVVIRSSTCAGGIDGGMIGAGRGGGACATEIDAIVDEMAIKAAPAASLAKFVVRIFRCLPVYRCLAAACAAANFPSSVATPGRLSSWRGSVIRNQQSVMRRRSDECFSDP